MTEIVFNKIRTLEWNEEFPEKKTVIEILSGVRKRSLDITAKIFPSKISRF